MVAWVHHVVHLRAARIFVEACESEDIPVLPVKGIVTAYTLYDDPAERSISDVDVRIRPRDYDRVGALARRRGWRFVEVKRAYDNYVLEIEGVQVDVECHVGPPHVCSLRVEDMLARSTRSSVLGFPANLPDFTDHVVLQMVNVFKDKLVLATHAAIEDLRRAVTRESFDATAIAHRLRECDVATLGWIVATSMNLSRWSQVRDLLPVRRMFVRTVGWATRRPTSLPSIFFARMASDSRREQMLAIMTMMRWQIESLRAT